MCHHASHIARRTLHVTRHASHVTRHTSPVTRHTSHVMHHTSHITRLTSHAHPPSRASLTPPLQRNTGLRSPDQTQLHTACIMAKAAACTSDGCPSNCTWVNNFNGFSLTDLNPMFAIKAAKVHPLPPPSPHLHPSLTHPPPSPPRSSAPSSPSASTSKSCKTLLRTT